MPNASAVFVRAQCCTVILRIMALGLALLLSASTSAEPAAPARTDAGVSSVTGPPEEAVSPMPMFKPKYTGSRGYFSKLLGSSCGDPPVPQLPPGHPDQVLLQLSPSDAFTVGDSYSHTQILGRTGCGKTTTLGDALGLAMLAQGYGGLVLSAKPEREHWRRLCQAVGREDDLIVIDALGQTPFNFLLCLMETAGQGTAVEAADLLMEACKAAVPIHLRNTPSDPFWTTSPTQLLTHVIRVIHAANKSVSLLTIMDVLNSLPMSPEDVRDESWWEHSVCARLIREADTALSQDDPGRQDFERTSSFLLRETASWGDRTRSSIVACISAPADALVSRPLREVLCGGLSVRPEDALHHGKIILVDLPTLQHGVAGRIANAVVKRSFFDAVQRRDPSVGPPIFVWSDESQETILANNRDASFAATARSQRCALVYLTQGRTNYDAVLGKESASSLLGNFSTHFAMSNGCVTTNQWFSQMIGKTWQAHTGISRNDAPGVGTQSQASSGSNISESFDDQFPAQRFTTLRTSTPQSPFADAVCVQSGRVWSANGLNYLPVCFRRVELP